MSNDTTITVSKDTKKRFNHMKIDEEMTADALLNKLINKGLDTEQINLLRNVSDSLWLAHVNAKSEGKTIQADSYSKQHYELEDMIKELTR